MLNQLRAPTQELAIAARSGNGLCRLVRTGNQPTGDRQSIPRIDGRHGEREVCQFLFTEVRLHVPIHRVGYMVANHGHRFSPRQRRAFALRVVRALTPGRQ